MTNSGRASSCWLPAGEFGESMEEAFGSRWENENRPACTGLPRFMGASCSDCGGNGNYTSDTEDVLHPFARERPGIAAALSP